MSTRLLEYGSFIIDKPDASAAAGTRAITDAELVATRETGTALDVAVHSAEVAGKPWGSPEHYQVYNLNLLGTHALKAALQVREAGLAKLTIDTVPPIETKGVLVRLDPERQRNARPDQLTFVPQNDFDKATSALRNRRVDL